MAKLARKKRRINVAEAERVRRIRDRYASALRLGHPIPDAARLASGTEPIPPPSQQTAEPPRPLPVEVKSEPPKVVATETVRVHGAPDGSVTPPSNPVLADPDKIPPNWQDLPWTQLKELVQTVTGNTPRSRADAAKAVEAVLGGSAAS